LRKPPPLSIEVPSDWDGRTVVSLLRTYLHLSRGMVRRLKGSAGILRNGGPVYLNQLCRSGDRITLYLEPLEQGYLSPEALPLAIVYEDDDLVIVDKPSGMLVHPVHNQTSGTLANGLVAHWLDREEAVSFHPVHRLDKLTSGLILIAKNPWCHQQMARQLTDRTMRRIYLAFCRGSLDRISGVIALPLKETQYVMKREITPEGKAAITRYRVLRYTSNGTLVAVKLLSGRTHQIRAHFAGIDHPLWGDPLYGPAEPSLPRLALHAVKLSFTHPRTGSRLTFKAPVPDDCIDWQGTE
jgi:23S rRNA pseudouridine1911/1915/1917 synthase